MLLSHEVVRIIKRITIIKEIIEKFTIKNIMSV
jgi:hypothetical protein